MMDCVGCGLWHCTMEDKRAANDHWLGVEAERDEARQQVETLREALEDILTHTVAWRMREVARDALAATKDGAE